MPVTSIHAKELVTYKGFNRPDALITAIELKSLIDSKNSNLVIIAVAKTTTGLAISLEPYIYGDPTMKCIKMRPSLLTE